MSDTPAFDVDELLRALLRENVRFMVIGGIAVAVHGFPRATGDLDVVPDPDPENLARLYDALQSLNARPLDLGEFRLEDFVPLDVESLVLGGNWRLMTDFGTLDVLQYQDRVLETPTETNAMLDRAIIAELPGVGVVPIVAFSDLIAMKLAAGRDQDLADVRALREARGEA